LARVTTDSNYLSGVLPAVLVFGFGLAITVAPLTATALSAVPSQHSGLASAVNNDVARIGSLIAVAVLPALAGISGDSYLHPAEFSKGFRTATLVAAVLCVAGGVLSAVGIRNPTSAASVPPAPPTPPVPAEPKEAGCYHCALEATPIGTRHSARRGAAR
jgi:hypothetical protein